MIDILILYFYDFMHVFYLFIYLFIWYYLFNRFTKTTLGFSKNCDKNSGKIYDTVLLQYRYLYYFNIIVNCLPQTISLKQHLITQNLLIILYNYFGCT